MTSFVYKTACTAMLVMICHELKASLIPRLLRHRSLSQPTSQEQIGISSKTEVCSRRDQFFFPRPVIGLYLQFHATYLSNPYHLCVTHRCISYCTYDHQSPSLMKMPLQMHPMPNSRPTRKLHNGYHSCGSLFRTMKTPWILILPVRNSK